MSGTRQQQHPWLADHVIFFSYRWLTWIIVAGLWVAYRPVGDSGRLLVLAALVNVLVTIVSQAYVRAAQRTPLLMLLDLVYMIFILVEGNGWNSPYFIIYATSSLVLPGLIFGSQGGFIAGWAFVTLDQGARWAVDQSAADLIAQGGKAGLVLLATMMAVPPLFGWILPWIVELSRRVMARRTASQERQRRPTARPEPKPSATGGGFSSLSSLGRTAASKRVGAVRELPLIAPTTAVRVPEPSVEDLRRTLFAPFPASDMDVPAVLELLATRFGEQTGASSRVTLLGRVRSVHYANRYVLIRLTQEALLNVQQHAHTAEVSLTLRYDASSVALLIQDNGVGLLDGTYDRPGGIHALRAMQYRLSELGGRLDVFETEGGGVTVRATMPLE